MLPKKISFELTEKKYLEKEAMYQLGKYIVDVSLAYIFFIEMVKDDLVLDTDISPRKLYVLR